MRGGLKDLFSIACLYCFIVCMLAMCLLLSCLFSLLVDFVVCVLLFEGRAEGIRTRCRPARHGVAWLSIITSIIILLLIILLLLLIIMIIAMVIISMIIVTIYQYYYRVHMSARARARAMPVPIHTDVCRTYIGTMEI